MINKNKDTIIINLFGGPGVAKSTTAALLFGKLKQLDIDCELVREYAKDLVWEERSTEFMDQISIFGKQLKRINSLVGKVDVIITDSPLFLSAYYNTECIEHFTPLCLNRFNRYNNLNIYLTRTKKYNPNGRFQTEENALIIDGQIKVLLNNNNIKHTIVPGDSAAVDTILENELLLKYLQK